MLVAASGACMWPRRTALGGGRAMPQGRGTGEKKQKKKSKEQLEKELKKKTNVTAAAPMTVEIVKPKRKERDW